MRRRPAAWRSPRRSPTSPPRDIGAICRRQLSANWMAACGQPGEDAELYDTVQAVGEELCPALGISDPGRQGFAVDEDAAGRRTAATRKMVAPLSLIVSAFAPVRDVRRTLTPQLRTDRGETSLLLIDLGGGRNRLGGSCLAQVYGSLGRDAPDCDDPRAARRLLRGDRRAARGGSGCSPTTIAPTAACSRPLRDGVRRALRRRARPRPQMPARSLRRCSARSSARCCRFARAIAQAVRQVLERHGLARIRDA